MNDNTVHATSRKREEWVVVVVDDNRRARTAPRSIEIEVQIDQRRVNGCSRGAKSRLIDLSRPRERSNDSSKLASIDPCLVDLLSLRRHFGRFFFFPFSNRMYQFSSSTSVEVTQVTEISVLLPEEVFLPVSNALNLTSIFIFVIDVRGTQLKVTYFT